MRNSNITLALSALLIASCSTFSGGGEVASASVDERAENSALLKLADAELEISRLKEENARLVAKMLEVSRQADAMANAKIVASKNQSDEPELPEKPIIIVEPPSLRSDSSSAVVDEATAPELAAVDVPVETSPRLVQPTFASTDAVFENEAADDFEMTSILFGVHLASYRGLDEAREGWRQLQRENPDELGLLEPRTEIVTLDEKGDFYRLIGGGFSSREKAAALCSSLKQRSLYCVVSGFGGDKLTLAIR